MEWSLSLARCSSNGRIAVNRELLRLLSNEGEKFLVYCFDFSKSFKKNNWKKTLIPDRYITDVNLCVYVHTHTNSYPYAVTHPRAHTYNIRIE